MSWIKVNHSAVDALHRFPPEPDRERFPDYYRAQPHVFELAPGDRLYIPTGWWHWVFSEGDSIAVNFWFKGDLGGGPRVDAGACAGWPALQRWDRGYLADSLPGSVSISASLSHCPNLSPVVRPDPAYDEPVALYKPETIAALNQTIADHPQCRHQAIVRLPPDGALADDILVPPELETVQQAPEDMNRTRADLDYMLDLVNIWLSVGDSQSGLHYDDYANLIVQVAGRKRCVLFAPEDEPHLYSRAMRVREMNLEAWAEACAGRAGVA